MRVIIAGGGIGGLTAALALHARPASRRRCTRARRRFRPLGVGINILPHAVRELTELGLGEALAATGIATSGAALHLGAWPGDLARAAWPGGGLSLAAIQHPSRPAAHAAAGRGAGSGWARGASTPASGSSGVSQDAGGATAHFADGSSATADAVVGADGIHSAARAQRHPDEGPPPWKGAVLWRATSVAPPFLGGATMIQCGHHDLKFVCYPIATQRRRHAADQLDRRAHPAARHGVEPGGLEPRRPGRGFRAILRILALGLPRRAGADAARRGGV